MALCCVRLGGYYNIIKCYILKNKNNNRERKKYEKLNDSWCYMSMASIVKSEVLKVKFRNETGINFLVKRLDKDDILTLMSGEEKSVSIPFNDMKLTTSALFDANTVNIGIIDRDAESGNLTLWGTLEFDRILQIPPVEQPYPKQVQVELTVGYNLSEPIEVWQDTTPLGAAESDNYNVTVVLKGQRGQESTLKVAAVQH